jgi:hypothetical protein
MMLRHTLRTCFAFCAFAISASAQTVFLEEDFNGGIFPPAAWSEQNNGVSPGWEAVVDRAVHDDYVGNNENWLISPSFDLSAASACYLHAFQGSEWTAYRDWNSVEFSVDGGATWQTFYREETIGDGRTQALELDLASLLGQPSVALAFRYSGDFANEWSIEWVRVDEEPPGIPTTWPELPSSFVSAIGFFDGFESGTVPDHVAINMIDEVTRSPDARAWCNVGQLAPSSWSLGVGSLEMGLAPGDPGLHYSANAWIVGLNGGGHQEHYLNLKVLNHGEEADPDDGIWVSVDGVNWERVVEDWTEATGGFQFFRKWVPLRVQLGKSGLDLRGNFYLAFAQADNRAYAQSDGIAIDEVQIWVEPLLTATENGVGNPATIQVEYCVPGSNVTVLYSLNGSGPTNTIWGKMELSSPIGNLGTLTANASGIVQHTGVIPNGLAGRNLWLHSSMNWMNTRVISNPLILQF